MGVISDGLAELFSVQRDLKYLSMQNEYNHYMPLSFVTGCTNLQKFELESRYDDALNDFKNLQHVNFSRLQVLHFTHKCPNHEYLIKFLERNGKNLTEIGFNDANPSLNSAIAKFCPNLKSLYTVFYVNDSGIENLKGILSCCQRLESLETWCGYGDYYLNETILLDTIVKCSPGTFHEL